MSQLIKRKKERKEQGHKKEEEKEVSICQR